MAEQASLVQEGVDRFREALDALDIQRVQKQIQARRKTLEKRIASNRRELQKRTRKGVKRVRSELKKNSLVKRAQTFQKDAGKQIDDVVDNVLGTLRIASKGDVARIDRKLNSISRKLKDIERARKSNGSASQA